MKEILAQSREFNRKELYKLCMNDAAVPFKNMEDGEQVKVVAYMLYIDENEKGEKHEILSLMAEDGKVYNGQSPTLRRSFIDIWELCEGEDVVIIKKTGVSKGGRTYVDCDMLV